MTMTKESEISNTKLSFYLFNARVSGDGVLPQVLGNDLRIEANIRSFEDRLLAETVFKCDWRETRIELDVGGSRAEEID